MEKRPRVLLSINNGEIYISVMVDGKVSERWTMYSVVKQAKRDENLHSWEKIQSIETCMMESLALCSKFAAYKYDSRWGTRDILRSGRT